ncbi:hypothetical protein BXZ70DRAFT_1074520 [Cristinia sonorae]|uniref:Uncharacterized protein n=1 Tax=Cristinia sonorae TaxID=1940300 RepID=A0A8K0UY50_9AGAR|nr:hypothetical protein BXZ70DRAFT_1074520 [Cristinia sonorae]
MPPSITSLRSHPLVPLTTALTSLLILYFHLHSPTSPSMSPSSLKDWYTRTIPHPSTSTSTPFTPTLPTLTLLVTHSSQSDPSGFTLALFKPNIAVDARGRVLLLTRPSDFEGLSSLASHTVEGGKVPETGMYLNAWRVKQMRTEQPFERLYVPVPEEGLKKKKVKVTSVQGFDGKQRELREPVEGLTELPDVLWDLTGLVLEARSGFVKGEEDEHVIAKVLALLDEVEVI